MLDISPLLDLAPAKVLEMCLQNDNYDPPSLPNLDFADLCELEDDVYYTGQWDSENNAREGYGACLVGGSLY